MVISHANGESTLYAHMSKRLVSEGDKVTQGQTIGLVGTTGSSTGNHLHFEVRLNGQRQDPLNYFRGSTFTAGQWQERELHCELREGSAAWKRCGVPAAGFFKAWGWNTSELEL